MNKIIVSALLLSGMAANAQQQQVGINTAEPKATLHVEAGASQNKGVIIPRITAAEMKTMTAGLGADHHSMMTYLKEDLPSADRTGKLAEVTETGYYFYNHTVAKWEKIGTSGDQNLRAILPSPYSGYNHITKDAGVGGNGTSAGTSGYNIAVGKEALYSNTIGSASIAIGMSSLKSNTEGYYNVAVGARALEGNTKGYNNLALGTIALVFNTTGNNNIAIGQGALRSNITGHLNIGLGYFAGDWMKGNGNVHIGNYTASTPTPTAELDNVIAIGNFNSNGGNHPLNATTTNDNVILLGETGSDGPKVGIGTYKPGAKLEVNTGSTAGAVKIVDGTQGAGKVLTSDANGLATWKEQRLVMIQGVKGSGVTIPVNGNAYIYTGSYITLPPGKYMVTVQNLMTTVSAYSDGHIWLRSTFSDSRTTFSRTSDIPSTGGNLISGLLPKGALFSMINGSVIINNTGTSPKTYYYWAGDVFGTPGTSTPLRNFGSHSEWSMIATPIQ